MVVLPSELRHPNKVSLLLLNELQGVYPLISYEREETIPMGRGKLKSEKSKTQNYEKKESKKEKGREKIQEKSNGTHWNWIGV